MATQPPETAIDPALDEALCDLKESDRQIIVLRYFKDLSISEVAAWFRVSENSASKRIERALARLRDQLSRRGVGVSTAALGGAMLTGAIRPAPKSLGAQIAAAAGSSAPVSVPLAVVLMMLSAKLKAIALFAALALFLCGTVIAIEALSRESDQSVAPPAATHSAASTAAYADPPGTTTIFGEVMGPDGKPVADALVTQGNYISRSTRTDAAGHFVLHGVAIGQDLDLTAHSRGLSPQMYTGIVTLGTNYYAFALKPAQTIRGRIVDVRGNPIAHVPLDPIYWRGKQVLRIYKFFGKMQWDGPETDANGVFVWSDAPPDPITFDPVTPNIFLRNNFTLAPSAVLQTVVVRDAIHVSIGVVDAQTHAPINRFLVHTGFGGNSLSGNALWPTEKPIAASGGKCEMTLSWSRPYHFFRIEAAGYQAEVLGIDESRTHVSLPFEVSREKGIRLSVLDPDGRPSEKAHVFCIPPQRFFMLQETQLLRDPRMAAGGGIVDHPVEAGGQLTIPDPGEGARIVALDQAGFANVLLADAAKGPIQLAAWAKVEGRAFLGARPARNQEISLEYISPDEGRSLVAGLFHMTTDEEGNFRYRFIPPGDCRVGIFVETNVGSRFQQGATSNPIKVRMDAGAVNHVTLGGSGRAIVGRIVGKDGQAIADAVYSLGSLSADRPMQYVFAVSYDGSFRLDDVGPGQYTLLVGISSGKTMQVVGKIEQKIVVDTAEAKDTPVDLGNLVAN